MTCIMCDAFQPPLGRMLSCIHIICVPCAKDAVAKERGCIKCISCGIVTKPRLSGVGLVEQLPRCVPSLYKIMDNTVVRGGVGSTQDAGFLCDLCEEEEAATTTHECLSCDAIALCKTHAEIHPKTRRYKGHIVRCLTGMLPGGSSSPHSCLMHSGYSVTLYCMTCHTGICTKCMQTAHQDHHFSDLSEAAATLKSALQKGMVYVFGFTENPAEPFEPPMIVNPVKALTTVERLLKDATSKMENDREECERASMLVADVFNEIEAAVRKKREQILQEIDRIHWKQLADHEARQQQLYITEERLGTLSQLYKAVVDTPMESNDVVQYANILMVNYRLVSDHLQSAEQAVLPCGKLKVTASTEYQLDLELFLRSLVFVGQDRPVDVTQCIVEFPDDVRLGVDVPVKVKFPSISSGASPALSAVCISPSERKYNIQLIPLPGRPGTDLVMEAILKPMEFGEHRLEIHDKCSGVNSATFMCSAPALVFDPLKSSPQIAFTNGDNSTVQACESLQGNLATAVATEGYTSGHHSWSIHVNGITDFYLRVGVTALPSDDKFDSTGIFFNERRFYCWTSAGRFQASPKLAAQSCSPLVRGDQATLVLDCERRTLEIRHGRTGERRVVSGLLCDEPLYPAVCLKSPGHQVAFI